MTRHRTAIRRLRLTCLAAIAGLGVPLLVSVSVGSSPAAGAPARLHPLRLAHAQQTMRQLEKRQETTGYLQGRAAYFDVRRFAGDKPISVRQAARLRATAAVERRSLSRSPATIQGRPAIGRAATIPSWQPLPETDTVGVGNTTGSFQDISGRVSAIAVDATGRIFVGAAQGGVWRFDPADKKWTPITDSLDSLAVGAIAIAPSNQRVIYLGTGEGDLSGDSYFGDGVYRSSDGGNTWQHVNGGHQFIGTSISKIVVDPKDPNRLYAATIRGKGGDKRVLSPFQDTWGVYRSVDGGHHWRLLKGTNQHERGATDLALDPHDSRTVYATFFGKGIYRTTGASHQLKWKRIMKGLPDGDFTAGPTRFAISATKLGKATRLYTGFEWTDSSGIHHDARIFRSDDGGNSWHWLPTGGPLAQVDSVRNYCDIQCDYDNVVTADPTHPDTVYVAGEYNYPLGSGGIYRSTDGGKTWLNLGLDLHPDFHAVALQPGNTSHVVIGNDGGVWDSAHKGGRLAPGAGLGNVHWRDLNVGLDITQMTNLAYSDHPPFEAVTGPVYYAGTQDNGTQIGPLAPFDNAWADIGGGDGGEAIVDPNKPQYVYGSFYGISPYRFDDAGGVTANGGINIFGQKPIDNGINPNDRSEFYVPWVQNQLDTNQMFLGTYRLYRSDNVEAPDAADVHWRPISPDLTTGCHGPAPNTGRGCLISAVGLAEGGDGVYVGTEEGLVQVSPDAVTAAHPTWIERDNGLPGRPVQAFAVDRSNWRTAYVAYAGYGVTTPGISGHVFKTTDGGQTWQDASGGASALPDNPVDDLVLDPSDPNTLFAGTDVGAFVTHDGGASWHQLGSGMPTVAVFSLEWNPARGRLVAGTHGRGGWTLDTGLQRPALVASTADAGTPVGPGSTIDYTVTVHNIGNADAQGVEVTQPLPPHTHFESAGDGGTLVGNDVHWSPSSIPAGGQVTLHYSVVIQSQLASTVTSIVADGLHVSAVDSAGNTYATDGSPHTTQLAPPLQVTLTPSTQEDGAKLGSAVTFPVTVTNKGYQSDSYQLSTDEHWTTTVLDQSCTSALTSTATLAPGQSQQICVRVDVPSDALDNDIDVQTLTATSSTDPTVHDTAKVTAIAVATDTLLVDEDGNGPDVQSYYADALKAAGVDFGVWDLSAHPTLPAGFLAAHKSVYWFTGTSWPGPLLRYERELSAYLDAGNNLFVSGQDMLDQSAGTTAFVHDYLHIDWDGSETQNDVPTSSVNGIAGTVLGDGFGAVPLSDPPGFGPFQDEITPIGPAVAQFQDDSGQPDGLVASDTSAVTGTSYKVAVLAFPLEGFGNAAARRQLVSRVQGYFGP